MARVRPLVRDLSGPFRCAGLAPLPPPVVSERISVEARVVCAAEIFIPRTIWICALKQVSISCTARVAASSQALSISAHLPLET